MGYAVKPGAYDLFMVHTMIEQGNLSYFDMAALEYHHFGEGAPIMDILDYFRSCLWKVHTCLLDMVITSGDLDRVSPILDEVSDELDMIETWQDLFDWFNAYERDFADFTSTLASCYEGVEG